jgi:hypothetical protein
MLLLISYRYAIAFVRSLGLIEYAVTTDIVNIQRHFKFRRFRHELNFCALTLAQLSTFESKLREQMHCCSIRRTWNCSGIPYTWSQLVVTCRAAPTGEEGCPFATWEHLIDNNFEHAFQRRDLDSRGTR